MSRAMTGHVVAGTATPERGRGTLMAVAGVLALSFDALLVRLADSS